MINFRPSETRTSPATSSAVTAEKAFSFISKGWREVKDSTEADLQLMKDRAKSFKNLASSFDREFENFLTSASRSTFPVPAISNSSSLSTAEIDFVKKLQPKLSEFRRAYSSPDFSKRVLEKWSPRAKIRIDLSAIRNAIVSEVDDGDGREGYRRTRVRDFSWEWKVDGDDGQVLKHWEPIRALKTRLRELEYKSSSSEIIEGLKNSELMEKVKSSLKAICKEPEYSKEVPPLDFQELLACLVRQSGPFLDYLGVKRGTQNFHTGKLMQQKENQLLLRSFPTGESSILEGGFWDDFTKRDSDERRHVAIVTTASLPWMTGTAVNPLFRAAYLAKSQKQSVTLLVPWLTRTDQELVYPNNITFSSPEEQEVYIRGWLKERVGFNADFKISFYPGKFQKERGSIIPAGDTSQFISSKDADIAILEEPEHLNWYHHGKRWTDKFNHVLRLSAATQDLPKSVICNVHGVNPKFLEIGERMAANKEEGGEKNSQKEHISWELNEFKLDVYGNGEDAHEVQSAAKSLDLNVNFMKGRDHADDSLHGYKVFVNPSVSDVLCTATAEALAMGKFVVCADHPSNDFFRSFPIA
ncbi:hypothetical protein E3N88_32900 [Mikania micrantha]|uniref:Digalactosyldiacylglycerol synthase n=1 Tax=Mikania micrantha TaxID=192012 RepID=A0A5N6M9W2_9ASTR|nr:hypothetical protein E3N88_32900 [Mikania micrantha]